MSDYSNSPDMVRFKASLVTQIVASQIKDGAAIRCEEQVNDYNQRIIRGAVNIVERILAELR